MPLAGASVTVTLPGTNATPGLPLWSLLKVAKVVAVFNGVVLKSTFATGLFVVDVGSNTVITNSTNLILPSGNVTGTWKVYTPGVVVVKVYVPSGFTVGKAVPGLLAFAAGVPYVLPDGIFSSLVLTSPVTGTFTYV